MAATFSCELTLSLDDSLEFARLSGDYNPLHLDPVVARRTQFGGTVAHGIHVLLAALDRAYLDWPSTARQPATLSVVFSSPVRTGSSVRICVEEHAEGDLRLTAQSDGRTAFSATIAWQSPQPSDAATLDDREYGPVAPHDTAFPPPTDEYSAPLSLSHRRLAALFPALATTNTRSWIADLLATTRIVGMKCPGLDSLYSACRLRRLGASGSSVSPEMRYRVDRIDDRFRMVRLAVYGLALGGSVEAFFRPRPVEQKLLTEILQLAPSSMFVGQRALVIGGSRGLGELTAKILVAGGADVTITYARGRTDAERVHFEASAAGYRLDVKQLALDEGEIRDLPAWLATELFSHVYYFASPRIAKNVDRQWNQPLFEQFSHFYIRAFAAVVESVLRAARASERNVQFLYPSSILLTEPESGFAEYCVAKAGGEALCEQLGRQYGASIARPRLPRMRTDQTNGLREGAAREPFPIMYDLLRTLCT